MPFSSILPTTVSTTPSTLSKELRARSSMIRAVAETIVSASLRKTENSDQVQIARPPRMMVEARANMTPAGARTNLRSDPPTVAEPWSCRDLDVSQNPTMLQVKDPTQRLRKLTDRTAHIRPVKSAWGCPLKQRRKLGRPPKIDGNRVRELRASSIGPAAIARDRKISGGRPCTRSAVARDCVLSP
jgi:hypothetical protein